jgi:hypothetical protein
MPGDGTPTPAPGPDDPGATPPVTGIGEVCDATTPCAGGGECVQLQGATTAFCSAVCATVASQTDPVPEAAHQTCVDGYAGSGTAACLVGGPPAADGSIDVMCGVFCGSVPAAGGTTTDLGTCDAPFMCKQDDPAQPGICI